MLNMQLSEDFNENDPKYKCCCGCCHVVTGVKLFLGLFMIGNIFSLFTAGSAVQAGLLFGVLLIVAPCTIYALIKEKHALLWAFIIVFMVSVVVYCVGLFLIGYFFFFNKEWARPYIENVAAGMVEDRKISKDQIVEVTKTVYEVLAFVILVQLAYNSWVLHVLFGCKRYFEDKSKAKIMYSTYAAPRPNGKFPTHG